MRGSPFGEQCRNGFLELLAIPRFEDVMFSAYAARVVQRWMTAWSGFPPLFEQLQIGVEHIHLAAFCPGDLFQYPETLQVNDQFVC